jgi:putative ABC transport system permease protein
MHAIAADLKFATRMLFKNPGFALVAIMSLALGIGANTAIFSLIDAVMLRMLPVSHPEQLMFVQTNSVRSGSVRISLSISNAAVTEMQARATSIAGVTSFDMERKLNIAVDGQAELGSGYFVAGNYSSLLGLPAVIGRTIGTSDDQPDGRVALLGFGYWQRRFGGDPGVVGRAITVNNVPFTVIGVTPREFYGISSDVPAEIMMPAQTLTQVKAGHMSSDPLKPEASASDVIVRTKPGVDIRQVTAELSGIFKQAMIANAGSDAGQIASIQKSWVELSPASQGVSSARNRFSEPLKVLMVVVAMVMLIACANIANLLLAKASARQREVAIRLSLGSTRWRLVRQLLTESLLLAVLGGIVGLVVAAWARDGIVYFATTRDGTTIPAAWNLRVFGFTAGICLLNALLFGIAPALRATGVDFAATMKTGRSGRMAGRLPLARILVAAQICLSLALLVGAALFLGTFRNLDKSDLGYDRDHALMVAIDPSLAGYKKAQAAEIYRQVVARIGTLPGVRSVSPIQSRLMGGMLQMSSLWVPGYTLQKGEDPHNLWAIVNRVGANYFTISGMHLVAGRDFTEHDNDGAQAVAVINETMAKHFFGSKTPIGQTIAWDREQKPITIVGVVRDFKTFGMKEDKQDSVFTPFLQGSAPSNSTILVRTTVDPTRVASDVRAAIRAVDAQIPQYDVITMDRQVENSLSQERLLALLSGAFGLLALGLAAIGLYGVLSYGVTQRTGEIGLRMALGAQRSSILRLILSETARLVAIGLVIGIGVAIAAGRAIKSLLYGVTPADGWSIGIAVAILTAVALIAGFLPARRASRVDPMVALRHE